MMITPRLEQVGLFFAIQGNIKFVDDMGFQYNMTNKGKYALINLMPVSHTFLLPKGSISLIMINFRKDWFKVRYPNIDTYNDLAPMTLLDVTIRMKRVIRSLLNFIPDSEIERVDFLKDMVVEMVLECGGRDL